MNLDSFDRIISYFHALATEPFSFKGEDFIPYKRLVISSSVFYSYVCPERCGACCRRVSLVRDQTEELSGDEEAQKITVNGIEQQFLIDSQDRKTAQRYCKHLSAAGRCAIHTNAPLPCKLELLKWARYPSRDSVYMRISFPGRKWALTRVDWKRGALCEITKQFDKKLNAQNIRYLQKLGTWMAGFNIANNVSDIVNILETGPHTKQFILLRGDHANKTYFFR